MSYTLIAGHETDPRPGRHGYISAMLKLMKENPKIVHIDCDMMGCIDAKKLAEAFPKQTFNAGIAEQNAVGVAAGMAATGLIPFLHTQAAFASKRCFDQVFLSAGYSGWPVHMVATDPGIAATFNGASHMPFEDAALFLTIPEAVVMDSCDYAQTESLTQKAAAWTGLTYMRFLRKEVKRVYADGSEFEIGKGVVLREGEDVTIISSGILLDEALRAEELLLGEKISARVIDMHTWKPLDEDLVLKSAGKTGCIVTAENHRISCGLGSVVSNLLTKYCPVPLERIGVGERYGQVGSQDFLMEEYRLTAEDIAAAARKAIARKNA